MRIIWYSGDAGVMRSSRSTSRIADRRRPRSGSFASAMRLRSSCDLVAFAFAELVLNRLELLAQEVLPLRVGHLLLRRATRSCP